MPTTARDRAEELVHNLQTRVKDFLAAEDGLVKAARDLIEQRGLAPADVRKRLDELMGRIRASKVWEQIHGDQAIETLNGYRDEAQRRVEGAVQKLASSFQIATKGDFKKVGDEIRTLTRKVEELSKEFTGAGKRSNEPGKRPTTQA